MSARDAGPGGGAGDRFASSRDCFEAVLGFLEGEEACGFDHGEVEEHLERQSRELFRRLFQDHLVIRSQREERLAEVVDAHAVARSSVESGHHRRLAAVFGEVDVERLAYRRRGHENLHPADALLNLPAEKHSHGLRRWAAIEGTRGSFDAAVEAIERATGQQVGKRQVESLAQCAAVDVCAFYAQRSGQRTDPADVLVLSVDGKGIVMRPDALRAGTRRASETSATKLKTRLSKGEKRGRKRMAELGAVYDLTPAPRDLDVTILIDLIHVLEYLWKAAWCFFTEGDTAAEDWVRDRALAILDGEAGNVAAGIRRRATSQQLSPLQRHGADTCADYLTNKAAHLDYPTALAAGWPIATGIIEGACRHIVKDRMDLTGARWSLDGAEAILKLRALRSNGDFDAYWRFHQTREQQRIHRSRYADNVIPRAA